MREAGRVKREAQQRHRLPPPAPRFPPDSLRGAGGGDRKSTRLNSSHRTISYAVFCLKKKNQQGRQTTRDPFADLAPCIVGTSLQFRYPSFFFSWDGDHRALHSFPTRRSSDLQSTIVTGRNAGSGKGEAGSATAASPPASRSSLPARQPPRSGRRRSEEHTSELQSPYDLVCRLLLEKKKPTRTSDYARPVRRSSSMYCGHVAAIPLS